MRVNIRQLIELKHLQDTLDLRIHNTISLPLEDSIDDRKLAFIVEFGELLQEVPSKFKYWKTSAIDNRELALEEFVDCLHFALSLTSLDNVEGYTGEKPYPFYDLCEELFDEVMNHGAYILENLISIGSTLGFTWEEVYQGYLDKNNINHERQDNGY